MSIIECTKENPWDRVKREGERVRHHNVYEVGNQESGWPSGDIITNECENCGTRWKEELPQ